MCERLDIEGKFDLHVDRGWARVALLGESIRDPKPFVNRAIMTPGGGAHWNEQGQGQRYTLDARAAAAAFWEIGEQIRKQEGRPPEYASREALLAAMRPTLDVHLGRHSEGRRPSLVFGVGVATKRPAKWFSELRTALEEDQLELTRRPDGGLEFRLVEQEKTIVLDPRTGFFESMTIDLKGGGSYLLTRTAWSERPFPPVQVPADLPVVDVPWRMLVSLVGALWSPVLGDSLNAVEGKSDAQQVLTETFTALGVTVAHVLQTTVLRGWVRRFVDGLVADGRDLQKEDPVTLLRDFERDTALAREALDQQLWMELGSLQGEAEAQSYGVADPALAKAIVQAAERSFRRDQIEPRLAKLRPTLADLLRDELKRRVE